MVKITPYIAVDGIRTFNDSYIKKIYEKMEEEGLVETVFPDGWIRSPGAFLEFMKHGPNYLFVIDSDHKLAAILWINRLLDRTCYAHFCGFKSSTGSGSVNIGRIAMRHLFDIKDDSGNDRFETVLGLLPSWNIVALKWLRKVGLAEVGKIPNALWNAKNQKSDEGMLLYITKEILGGLE